MPLSKILGFQSDKWDNPEESTGTFVGFLRGGRYRCWEAAGRARQTFSQLSPEIKDYLEASSIPPTDTVSWSIYMIGHTAETAAPKLLICSTDYKTRKHIRKLIKDSKIMEKYPGVGLGDVSTLPDRHSIRELSREAIEALLPPGCDADGAVVAEGSEPVLGKRIFIVNPNDYSLRPATAGPVILQGDECYQLTVAHAFQHNREPDRLSGQAAAEDDDCDFDGMSDDEGDYESQDNEMTRRWSATPEGMDSDKGSFTANLDMFSSGEGSEIWSKSPSSDRPSNEHDPQHSVELLPDNLNRHGPDVSLLRFYGRLALTSVAGSNPSLDYALIKIPIAETSKHIPLLGNTTGPLVSAIGEIGLDDINIIAATSQHCLVDGQLTATSSYIRLPGHGSFQRVYPVRLDKTLTDGDCGTAVFGKHNSHFYGHVVAGGPGTGIAYLVPASEISKDIEARLGHGLAMIPQNAAMASPGLLLAPHAFRLTMGPPPSDVANTRVSPRSDSTLFGPPMIRVLIRRLPLHTSEDSLRLMLVWAQDLSDIELLPFEQSEDPGFRSALVQFRTMAGAQWAKKLLDGRTNTANGAATIVEILSKSPMLARQYPIEDTSGNVSSSAPSAMGQEIPQRIYGALSDLFFDNPFGLSSTRSTISSDLSSTDFSSYYGDSVSEYSTGTFDSSTAASDTQAVSSRTLPKLPMASQIPPAPHYPFGQFSSKVSSSTEKKHKCRVCDRRFRRPSSLQTHMYSHTGEKPFACEVEGCGRQFSVVSNLRRHRKVHRGDTLSEANSEDEER